MMAKQLIWMIPTGIFAACCNGGELYIFLEIAGFIFGCWYEHREIKKAEETQRKMYGGVTFMEIWNGNIKPKKREEMENIKKE